jgi:Flp pilus assembly protein CpaB
MKRRSWLWFVASAILAILAGILAVTFLRGGQQPAEVSGPKQSVVVARNPIVEGQVIEVDNVTLTERDSPKSGAAIEVTDVLGGVALRAFAQGEILVMQDILVYSDTRNIRFLLDDKIAVALPADDILSKWGTIVQGDHVDVLVSIDVILETPMFVEDIRSAEVAELYAIERDQSFDNVAVLPLQNLEVLQVIQEPQTQAEQRVQGDQAPEPRAKALLLKIDPQDAVVLKYIRDSIGRITLALRSPERDDLWEVEPVNINYLMLRYGIVLPQPLQ